MKKTLILTALLGYSGLTYSQINAGNDTLINCNDSITLLATVDSVFATDSYVINPIPYNPDPWVGPNIVPLAIDDQHSGVYNIGFDFCYYGNTYTQFVVSSNNYITFDLAQANQYSPWDTEIIPDPAQPVDAIMGPWQDINPAQGGTISYGVYGTAPFRRLVVSYDLVPMYQCGNLFSSQIVIYETTNEIETHIGFRPICTWNNGEAVHALHNAAGNLAEIVTGRNNTAWSVTNEGMRWTPAGAPAFTVNWYDNGNLIGGNGTVAVPNGPTNYVAEVVYTCNNASITDTVLVDNNVANFTISATVTPTACTTNTGVGIITPIGTGVFSYDWNPGGYTDSMVTGLGAGMYTITVTDTSGCYLDTTITIDIDNTVQASILTFADAICNGESTGTATAFGTGGVGGSYSYFWNDPLTQTDSNAVDLPVGTWDVIVMDSTGCADTVSVTIDEPPVVSTLISGVTDVLCNGTPTGGATVTPSGGNGAPFTYQWTAGTTPNDSITGLPAGTHYVTVTDSLGCTAIDSVVINEPPPIAFTLSINNVSCNGGSDGSATVTGLTGGTPPYTYLWNDPNNQTGSTATGLPVGTFDVVVTDANGCTHSAGAIINEPPPLSMTLSSNVATCGLFDGDATATPTGGASPYTYSINGGASQSSANFNGLSSGTYGVTVTDVNGCTYTDSIVVGEVIGVYPDFTPTPGSGTAPLDVTFMNNTTGGVIHHWNFGDGSDTTTTSLIDVNHFYDTPGTYTITLVSCNAGGCCDSVLFTITIDELSDIEVPNIFSPNGDGVNDFFVLDVDGVETIECQIYNRWGTLIFEWDALNGHWAGETKNGDAAPEGTYYYMVRAVGKDGTVIEEAGHVTLTR